MVAAHNVAVHVQKVAVRVIFACVALHKADVVAVGHKADVLAVVLARVAEALLLGDLADGRFVHAAQRELRVRQLVLGQNVEHIALVFIGVQCFFQQPAARGGVLLDAGVVACDHIVQTVLPGKVQHFVKFHRAVAVDTGVRRAARLVGLDELGNDLFTEFLGVVHDLKRDVELERDLGGVFDVLRRAAGVEPALAQILILVQAHGRAHAAAARLLHQVGGDGAVHAAAHGDQRAGGI